ncbi:hypothetical protein JYT90_00235 [bacterium AH-315-P07]|nr:hypothetical protein [bacterium AH-315-P07]
MTKPETLEIEGQLKKLWLTNFRGYTLLTTRREPQSGMLGRIRYKNVWVLQKNKEKP